MQRIRKAPETMTARERVRRTFEFEKTDRVTIGYEANAAIHARLCRELGVASSDLESVYQALGVDYRLEPECTVTKVQPGDLLLLCSDGLTNAVPRDQMEQLLSKGAFYDLPDRLVDAANENGGPDNITALLLGVEPMEVRHG